MVKSKKKNMIIWKFRLIVAKNVSVICISKYVIKYLESME